MSRTTILEPLRNIAGYPRLPNYGKGHRPDTEYARQLIETLEAIDPAKLTWTQLDYLSRILSAGMAGIRRQQMSQYFSVREWKPKSGHPLVDRVDRGLYDFFDRHGILDHISRLVEKDAKRSTFRSEPYSLGNDAIKRLAELCDDGWNVTINGKSSTHYPGDTIAVLISKPAADETVD